MKQYIAATLLATTIALLGCKGDRPSGGIADTTGAGSPPDSQSTATASLRDASGKELGTLTLRDAGGRIALSGRLTGLPRNTHAIHLHTVGKCEAPKFESAGSHWNPTGREHGTENPNGPHLGDFPNVTAGPDGSVQLEAVSPGGTLKDANPLLDNDGASVVVHAKADDYKTDPSGNSGDRIACGVVGR